jgi:hypothetical protein
MKKISTAIVFFAIAVTAISFTAAQEWFVRETSNYTIQFPAAPEHSMQSVPSEIGDLKMEINIFDASKTKGDDNLVYGLVTSEYPDSLIDSDNKEILPTFFRNSTDGAVTNVKGKLLSEKEISLGSFPGYEIRIDFQEGMAIITMRSYLVHNKMYVLQVISETAKEKNRSADKFFNSFKLKS